MGANLSETSTLRSYNSHVANHLVPRLGHKKLTAITPPVVRALLETMIADGMSRAMTKKVLTSLSAIFTECRARGIVATNPCDGISLQVNAGRHKKEIEVPSKDDVRAVLRYVDDRAKRYPTVWRRWQAFIYFMVHTGVRISEARGLPGLDAAQRNRERVEAALTARLKEEKP